MKNIVFSIPVHEKPEVIIDQIINFKHFNENAAFVLHFSKSFSYKESHYDENSFLEVLQRIGDVYVNPNRLRTGWGDIIQTHVSNFLFVASQIDFEYFALASSNEMFVKKGLYEKIHECDYGCSNQTLASNTEWPHYEAATHDESLKRIMDEVGSSGAICSWVEGTFYKKDIFRRMCGVINDCYYYEKEKVLYPREEIYFSTIARALFPNSKSAIGTYCKMRWDRELYMPLGTVKKVLKGNDYFSIKRVDRDYSDPLREIVRFDIGKYSDEEKPYIDESLLKRKHSRWSAKAKNASYCSRYVTKRFFAKIYHFFFRKKATKK